MISKQQDKCINLSNSELTNVGIYSISHALIDGCCAAVIAANIALGKYDLGILSYYIVLYNIVAFALQAPVGLIVDKLQRPTEAAVLGCLLVLLGIFTYRWVGFALIISGLGNAFFHIGGGVIILNLRPGKASLPGKPGFAFGLTTLALIIGAFPTFTGLKSVLCSNNGIMIMGTVLIMTLILRIGLKSFFS